ncbi:MAG: hypothetical protein IH932_02335 [Thaumarchaeota archaeon]|nr:hypothetical protein [Nitrososphaerota archaeon]
MVDIKRQLEEELLGKEGIVGIGIGHASHTPDHKAINIYVEKLSDRLDEIIKQKSEEFGIDINVIETGRFDQEIWRAKSLCILQVR